MGWLQLGAAARWAAAFGLCAWITQALPQPAAAQATQPETIDAAEAAYRQNPTDPSAAVLYARALTRAGQPDRAVGVLEPLLSSPKPAIRNRIRLELANALVAAERLDEAGRQIDQVAAAQPTPAQVERIAKLRQDLQEKRADIARRVLRQQIAEIKARDGATPDSIHDALEGLVSGPAANDPELLALIRVEQANQRLRQDRLDDAAAILSAPPVATLPSQSKRRGELLAKIDARRVELAAEQRRKAVDERIAAADTLAQSGDLKGAEDAYRAMLAEQPPLEPKQQQRVQMALANVLQKRGRFGDARDILDQVDAEQMNVTQRDRLGVLRGRIDDRLRPNQFSGWLQFGFAYDDDAPAVYSANRTESDTDVVTLLPEQGLDDTQEAVSGRVEYRRVLSGDLDFWSFAAQGLKTWQNDLDQLDRAQIRVSTGPTIVFPDLGVTTSLAGGYQRLWKSDSFNNNEYSVDLDIGWDVAAPLELGAFYSHIWHDDVRLGKDGERNDFGFTADYRLTDLDRVTLRARALRIDEELPDNESWSHSYDAYYSHLFPINERIDLFAEANVGVDFVLFDDPSASSLHLGDYRRDTILTWGLGGGAVLDDVWTGRLGYYRYELDSNFDEKDKDDNRVFLTLRRSF
jgi:predicted negative regulator of RcsB-dependent stress response